MPDPAYLNAESVALFLIFFATGHLFRYAQKKVMIARKDDNFTSFVFATLWSAVFYVAFVYFGFPSFELIQYLHPADYWLMIVPPIVAYILGWLLAFIWVKTLAHDSMQWLSGFMGPGKESLFVHFMDSIPDDAYVRIKTKDDLWYQGKVDFYSLANEEDDERFILLVEPEFYDSEWAKLTDVESILIRDDNIALVHEMKVVDGSAKDT